MKRHLATSPEIAAFSLVELSIVLVILGLLVGGILGGQSLIRAAELRSVSTQYQQYITASHTFRDKYFALAGDLTNADAFWSSATNGNGNGLLEAAAGSNAVGEIFQFWKQLALAGLIEGTYSGTAGGNTGIDTTPGVNAPVAKIASTAGWGLWSLGANYGDVSIFQRNNNNTLILGGTNPSNPPIYPALRTVEAWNIDTKMDDGKPGTGKITVRSNDLWGGSGACTNATIQTDYAATYTLDRDGILCALFFPQAF